MDKIFDKLNINYQQLEKFNIVHFAGLGLFVAACFGAAYFFLVHGDKQKEIADLEAKEVASKRTLDQYQRVINEEPVVRDSLATLVGELSEKKRQMPSEKELPRLLNKVADLGEALNLNISSFNIQGATTDEFYQKIPMSIKISGGYSNTAGFFDALQNLLQLVKIDGMNMKMGMIQEVGEDEDGLPSLDRKPKLSTAISATAYAYLEGK
ncbi:MAG: type 4a pilus biogenesis protein PilO [Nitrospinales bacterium]